MTMPFKHNGVTTERAECAVSPASAVAVEHDAHKWRPGERTEWFTCPGLVKCQYCSNLIWRDKMVQHLQDVHADKLTLDDAGPATHTGRPAMHSGSAYVPAGALAVEECDHPNGFGPYGCAGCGSTVSDELDRIEAEDEPRPDAARAGFHAWWVAQVDEAAPTIERKAAEYGSNSLAEMGRMFARARGVGQISDAEALEIGCMIYAKGKLERVLDAMLKGKLPSVDTWHDLGVYSAMAQYIRENKRWP